MKRRGSIVSRIVLGSVIVAGIILVWISLHPIPTKTAEFVLPHASEVVVVEDFKIAQGVRLGGSAVVPMVEVNFTVFSEHARGMVYVEPNRDFGRLEFYAVVNNTLWTCRVNTRMSDIKSIRVNGTTVIVEGSG